MTRQEAIEWLNFMWEQEYAKGDLSPTPCNTEIALQMAIDALKQPEIVRCKDCEHGVGYVPICEDIYCVMYDQRHNEDWFCADGGKDA